MHALISAFIIAGINILAIPPPWWGRNFFLSKLKYREEFEGGLEKERKGGKRRKKKKRVIKHTLKYTFMKLKYRKKYTKTGKNFRGWGGRIFLAGQNIYP